MTNQAATIIAFPFLPKEPGTYLTDAQLFWGWKMQAASYLNLLAERGLKASEKTMQEIRTINGHLVDLGYDPLDVDF